MVWACKLVHLVSQVVYPLSCRSIGVPLWVNTRPFASSVAAYVLMTFSTDDLSLDSRSLDSVGKSWWNISGLGHSYLNHPLIFRMEGVYMWVVLAWPADSHVLRLCLVSGRQKFVPVVIVCCPFVSEAPLTYCHRLGLPWPIQVSNMNSRQMALSLLSLLQEWHGVCWSMPIISFNFSTSSSKLLLAKGTQ